jgi:hypothetical protein
MPQRNTGLVRCMSLQRTGGVGRTPRGPFGPSMSKIAPHLFQPERILLPSVMALILIIVAHCDAVGRGHPSHQKSPLEARELRETLLKSQSNLLRMWAAD